MQIIIGTHDKVDRIIEQGERLRKPYTRNILQVSVRYRFAKQ